MPPEFTGIGRRKAPEPPPQAAPPTDEDLAARALATQDKPQTLAALLSAAQQRALAATLGADGLATDATADAVREVLREVFDRQKAASDDLEEA